MNGIEISRRVTALKSMRSNVEQIWNDVERYIMPLRVGNMYERNVTEPMIRWNKDEIFDSTAIHAAQKFAASIHGTVTNPAFKWFDYAFKDKKLRQDKVAQAWLQECTEIAYEELYDSNFDPEISSGFQDLVGLGNTILVSEIENENPLDWQGFNFTCVPVKECFFERDHRGNLYRFYRWLEWTAIQIKSKWPEGVDLPEEVKAGLEEGADPDKKFAVIFCVYQRDDKKQNRGSLKALANSERPYGSKYILMKDGTDLCGTDGEGGYYEMPAFHCPWEKTSGSMWGHGPGMVMAPTVKYINSWLEMQDMAVRKLIDPPVLTTERGLMSDLDLKPGGQTVVRDLEKSLKVFLSDSRIDFSKMTLDDLRNMVRSAFHEDELQLRESPQMSATEAQIRYELMNRVLGPTMGRIQNNMLDPMLMRHFMSCLRNNRFPKMPDVVIQAKAQFKIHYSGPLVRAQKQDEVATMERFLGQVGAAAKVFPTVMNVIDPVEWAREVADRLGIPAKILRSPSEVEKLTKEQQQLQAKMAQGKVMQEHGKGQQEMQEAKNMTQENE